MNERAEFEQPVLVYSASEDDKDWILGADWCMEHYTRTRTTRVCVPPGERFNLASVPVWVPRFIADDDDYPAASLMHDKLYEYSGKLPASWFLSPARSYTRDEADRLFYMMLVGSGAPRWRAELMYRAVRWFGGRFWGWGHKRRGMDERRAKRYNLKAYRA